MNIIKKSVVFDARMINNSGIGRYIDKILINTLPRFSNLVVLGDEKYLETRLKNENVSIINFTDPFYSIAEQINYPKIIPKCDLFWSPHLNVPLFPIKANKRLVTLHDVFHLAFHNTLTLSQKIYAKVVIDAALRKSDKVITVSEFSKKEIIKYTNKKYESKIKIVHNGVDPILGNNGNTSKIDQINYDYFLAVGNIKPHKNFRRAIEAYKLFLLKNEKEQNIPHLVIIGKMDGLITADASAFDIVEKHPLLRKYVHFLGKLSDCELKMAYKRALALIFPSIYEGFGFPPLEAMLENTPVIISNAACMPEICGDAAIYFDPYDIHDISNKMNVILKNTAVRHNLKEKGLQRAKMFTWENAANSTISIIETLINK